jgi:hypothetical protein
LHQGAFWIVPAQSIRLALHRVCVAEATARVGRSRVGLVEVAAPRRGVRLCESRIAVAHRSQNLSARSFLLLLVHVRTQALRERIRHVPERMTEHSEG